MFAYAKFYREVDDGENNSDDDEEEQEIREKQTNKQSKTKTNEDWFKKLQHFLPEASTVVVYIICVGNVMWLGNKTYISVKV